jgi:SAM-dependent methyltransferase
MGSSASEQESSSRSRWRPTNAIRRVRGRSPPMRHARRPTPIAGSVMIGSVRRSFGALGGVGRAMRRRSTALPTDATGIEYWKLRARKLGTFAALNCSHRRRDEAKVTDGQRRLLLPILKAQLNGEERTAVDVGCGPGRFTSDIARAIDGEVIGVDPISELLALAPPDPLVRYMDMAPGHIPLCDSSVDLVWICLVLGGIVDASVLSATVAELDRVLRPGGLIFLVENTSVREDGPHWFFRGVDWYLQLLPFARLELRHQYEDLGETISVMSGRTRSEYVQR